MGMKRLVVIALTAVTLLLAGLPGRADVTGEAVKGAVELYDGTVEVEIFLPDRDGRVHFDWGDATASFTLQDDGQMAVAVTASIEDENDVGFHLLLEPSGDSGWQGVTDEWILAISPAGKISGHGQSIGQQVSMAGTHTLDYIALELIVTITDDTLEAGLSPGTQFVFEYTLHRQGASDQGTAECARIGWRMQVTPNLWGGAMDMMSVPYCIEED
jgi:hypothetical protein